MVRVSGGVGMLDPRLKKNRYPFDIPDDPSRLLALGKLVDLQIKLSQWKTYRELRYEQYEHAERSGASEAILNALERELGFIVDKVAKLEDEYEAQLNYVRKKGWL